MAESEAAGAEAGALEMVVAAVEVVMVLPAEVVRALERIPLCSVALSQHPFPSPPL